MKKIVLIGDVAIGSDNKIAIQSMTNIKTSKKEESLEQIKLLEQEGCDIVRVAIDDQDDINGLKYICKETSIPIVADIQHNYKLALESIEGGASKIRMNPSYMNASELSILCSALKKYNLPIRVGVNEGSVKKKMSGIELANLAIENINLIESHGVEKIVVAVKSTNISKFIIANKYLAQHTDYPLHLGLTEAGLERDGVDKSYIALGGLLLDGIGDTIRLSLAEDPIKEVQAAKRLLSLCGLGEKIAEVIACPTCGRANINVISLTKQINDVLNEKKIKLKIAIMGCAINGIGESKRVDIGVCGGKENSLIFYKGNLYKKVDNNSIYVELLELIESHCNKE